MNTTSYTVKLYTAGKPSTDVTIPMSKRDAMKVAGKFNQDSLDQNIDPQFQHFFIEKV
jgi:hypothetical protein